jgi:hypothetical protein
VSSSDQQLFDVEEMQVVGVEGPTPSNHKLHRFGNGSECCRQAMLQADVKSVQAQQGSVERLPFWSNAQEILSES